MSEFQEATAGPLPERLVHEFEQLGLSPYEARILLAVMRLGSGNTAQLSAISGVPRTSTYQILEELNRKGLAQRLAVDGPAVWGSPGREAIFDRMDAAEEERLREHRNRTTQLRELVAETFPDDSTGAGPYVHIIQGARHVSRLYDRLVAEAREELLVFNRPPYSQGADRVNPTVIEALQGGLRSRVLYEREQWNDPSSDRFREAMGSYHQAGVEARLVDELPLKLAVVDRKVALLAMADPVLPEIGFPTTLLVEHPGYASLQADAFEQRWSTGTPVEPPSANVDASNGSRRAREQRWLAPLPKSGRHPLT
jgi:sugar-specific transcriptional regulator TrmB